MFFLDGWRALEWEGLVAVIVWETPFLTIHWDEEIQAVQMEWKQFAGGDDFRAALDKGLSLIAVKQAHRWLADLRNLGPVTAADQRWSNEDWFPRAIAGGIRAMALVAPHRAVAQLSVRTIMSKVDDKELETAYFDSVEAARNWLKTR